MFYFNYVDPSVLLENIPLVKFIKTTSFALVRKILFCYSKIRFISLRHRVISSIYSLSIDSQSLVLKERV